MTGRTSQMASNSTGPASSPPVISTSGVAMRSTSCSRTALARYCGMASRSACSRAAARPMRASSTLRGTLPARKPGQADLAGDLAERLVDVAVEFGLVDGDRQLHELARRPRRGLVDGVGGVSSPSADSASGGGGDGVVDR